MSLVPGLGTRCRLPSMLKGEDIVLLLKLSDSPPDWTVRTLAEETSIPVVSYTVRSSDSPQRGSSTSAADA